jgi:uracil phosphoribosyltransferase
MKGRYIEIDHPLLKHKLGLLRDKETTSARFREVTKQISGLMVYEVMRDWDQFDRLSIETPICKTEIDRITNPPVVVSVLRAGNGMLDAILTMMPFAPAGFIGIYRDKFIKNTVEYYFKLPADVKGKDILICDPLIATADTMVAALDRLKNYEVGRIKVISILASKEGVEKVHHFHPDVDIYSLSTEAELTEEGYLVPGLGDAGDRLFKTK